MPEWRTVRHLISSVLKYKILTMPGSIRYRTKQRMVWHFFGPVPDWNSGCRNANAVVSFLDANAQQWLIVKGCRAAFYGITMMNCRKRTVTLCVFPINKKFNLALSLSLTPLCCRRLLIWSENAQSRRLCYAECFWWKRWVIKNVKYLGDFSKVIE
jgi:hypothetical protein